MSAGVRLGLAGCGRIAERGYLPALAGLAGVELVHVADSDPARADRLASLAGAAAFDSTAAMVAAGGIDALLVATPVEDHLLAARQAAAAGLPSLVEKPPAADLETARALAALDPAPAIGFNRRFLQGTELLGAIPAAGWLELDLELRFSRSGWGAHASRDEALLDAGIHLIDLACFLAAAAPIAVRGAAVEPERAQLELELARGRARIRCATDARYAERVRVGDRSGRTLAASRTGRLDGLVSRLRGGEEPLVGSLRRQLGAFVELVEGGGGQPLAGAGSAVRALAVVEAARRSAALDGAEIVVAQEATVEA